MKEIYVHNEDMERLDFYLTMQIEGLSRTSINKLIRQGFVQVNEEEVKPSYEVKKGDLIRIKTPPKQDIELIPENIFIDIIYEDDDIIIINKPKGMITHPTDHNYSGTLVNALLYHVGQSNLSSSKIRPGIVHRLDKDTTGLLVIAKNDNAYGKLSQQFIAQTIERKYLALVHGDVDVEKAIIDAPIGRDPANRTRMKVINENSKNAITHYRILKRFDGYTLLQLSLQTGRTHQIRVHMKYIGHPIVGDPIYSDIKDEFKIKTQLLHANKLAFYHPGNDKYIEFKAQLPENFTRVLKLLKKRGR